MSRRHLPTGRFSVVTLARGLGLRDPQGALALWGDNDLTLHWLAVMANGTLDLVKTIGPVPEPTLQAAVSGGGTLILPNSAVLTPPLARLLLNLVAATRGIPPEAI